VLRAVRVRRSLSSLGRTFQLNVNFVRIVISHIWRGSSHIIGSVYPFKLHTPVDRLSICILIHQGAKEHSITAAIYRIRWEFLSLYCAKLNILLLPQLARRPSLCFEALGTDDINPCGCPECVNIFEHNAPC
jgi:hypothetical protein